MCPSGNTFFEAALRRALRAAFAGPSPALQQGKQQLKAGVTQLKHLVYIGRTTFYRLELLAGHFSGCSKRARGPQSSPRGQRSQRAQT
eukprot:15445770-Alexandrium_andersonii.AAC.1